MQRARSGDQFINVIDVCSHAVSCGDPGVPSNGRRIGDQFLYRDEVMFECDDGYYMSSGSQERECLITGEWNGTQPICTGE